MSCPIAITGIGDVTLRCSLEREHTGPHRTSDGATFTVLPDLNPPDDHQQRAQLARAAGQRRHIPPEHVDEIMRAYLEPSTTR